MPVKLARGYNITPNGNFMKAIYELLTTPASHRTPINMFMTVKLAKGCNIRPYINPMKTLYKPYITTPASHGDVVHRRSLDMLLLGKL